MSNNAPSPHRDLDLEPPVATGATELAAVFLAAATAAPAWAATAEPERAAVLEALAEALTRATDELVSVADRETLRKLLTEVPERERNILALRFFANLTQSEIAERIGVSQMHVSRLLSRTLGTLRSRLQEA